MKNFLSPNNKHFRITPLFTTKISETWKRATTATVAHKTSSVFEIISFSPKKTSKKQLQGDPDFSQTVLSNANK